MSDPVDPVALYMAAPPSTAELAAAGFNRFDYFTHEDFLALARLKAEASNVIDIRTRRAYIEIFAPKAD